MFNLFGRHLPAPPPLVPVSTARTNEQRQQGHLQGSGLCCFCLEQLGDILGTSGGVLRTCDLGGVFWGGPKGRVLKMSKATCPEDVLGASKGRVLGDVS